MTSLDQQLRRLAVPHTRALLGEQRQRASLLFDKSEAATIGREELYAIGINGLQALENVEPAFQVYETSLFAEASQTFERTQQSKAANDALDKTIAEFLIKLSPYFLLKAATKALEWLIYRYRIHLQNVDDILCAIFPYYSTSAFVKVIQTFRLDKKSGRWFWLLPLQERGAPLARSALLNQCIKDPNFLTFMCSVVPKHIEVQGVDSPKALTNVINFYTSTLVGSLQLGKIKETTISTLLPYLLGGFKSKCADYKASAFIITSQIAGSVKLEESLLQRLVVALTKHPDNQPKEMLMSLLVICQTQEMEQIQKRTFKHVFKIAGVVEHLEILSSNYQTEKLLKLFFSRLVPYAIKDSCSLASSSEGDDSDTGTGVRPQYLSLLEAMLQGSRLEDGVALRVAELFAEQYSTMKDRRMAEPVLEKIRRLFATVEKKYPNAIDQLAEKSSEDESVQELLSSTNQNLILGLNHVNAEIRRIAVEKLSHVTTSEESSIERALLSRLDDDSADVVGAVLKLNNLKELVSQNVSITKLMELVDSKHGMDEWKSIIALAINHLIGYWSEAEGDTWWQIYNRLLPYLLADTRVRNDGVVDMILKSKVASNDAVLKGLSALFSQHKPKLSKSLDKSQIGEMFCALVVRQSPEYLSNLIDPLMILLGKEESRELYEPVALRLLIEIIQNCKEDSLARLTYSRLLLDIVNRKIGSLEDALQDSNGSSTFEITSDSSLVLHALSTVISKLERPKSLKDKKWWNTDQGKEERLFMFIALDILKLLSSFMTKTSYAGDVCRKAATSLSNSCFSMPMIYFNLVSAAYCGDEAMTPVYQLQSLYYAKIALTNADPDTIANILSSKNATVHCLLIALNSEYQPVREAAIALMKKLVESSGAQPYHVLCKRLVKVSGELVMSGEYLTQALSAIYDEPSEGRKRRKSGVNESQLLLTALNDLLDLVSYDVCSFAVKEAVLTSLGLVQNKDILMRLLPLLSALLKRLTVDGLDENGTRCFHLLVHRFTPEIVQIFEDSEMARELFYACLSATEGHHPEYMSIQRLSLKQVSKAFYESLPTDELRQSLLCHLFNIWVDNEDSEVNKVIGKKIRSLPLSVDHLSVELRKLLPDKFETVKDTKRVWRRSMESKGCEDSIFDTKPWKRTTFILEIIQNKKNVHNIHKLTPDLFALLKFAMLQENQSSADYFKQLVLSCLMVVYQCLLGGAAISCEELDAEGARLDVELIIQCIRTSDSSQTYHHALMLLSKAVLLDPERVLHNVMSIFTFMGANIMRQDDSYSFKVLTDTIDSIIPALLKANQNTQETNTTSSQFLDKLKISPKLASSVKHILQVFVDAYPHMPQHRRLPLFEKLMRNVKPTKFLWLLIVLMIDAHTVKLKQKNEEDTGEQKVDEFCLRLCDSVPIQSKIRTAYKLLMYINIELKDSEKKDDTVKISKAKATSSSALIDFTQYKLKEVKMLKYALVGLIAQLLTDAGTEKREGKEGRHLVEVYEQTMEECLLLITYIGRALSQETNNYWQALLAGAYRILDELQALLKHDVYVKVIGGLIKNDLPIIRRKTMELLANKLSMPKFSCEAEQVKSFLYLIPLLAKAARTRSADGGGTAAVANRQAALLALRAMCRNFGAQNPSEFQQLLPLVSKLITETTTVGVKSSAVALLAELVTCLRAHAVSSLSSFMPGMLQILEQHRNQDPSTDTLLPNTVAAVQKIVEVLPNFISPYLFQLLSNVFWHSSRYSAHDANQKTHIAFKLLTVRKHLSKHIPTRVFLPSLTKCYTELNDVNQWRAIQPIMTTLADHISIMTTEDVGNYNNTILNLFLTALDFRVEQQDLDLADVALVENDVNEALASLVMKLSESTFRPLFYRLFDWATNAEASKDRLLTFYRLCDGLATKMKNLFTKFAGHVLQNVAVLLDANNLVKTDAEYFQGEKSTEKSSALLNALLDVLYKCFLYDNEGFVTKQRFETLMPPLVLQLENMQGGIEIYQDRVANHLVQCLSQLAVAAGGDGSWKPLNYQVCLQTRHANASVRFASLQVIECLHDKLGSDYMTILPETIQFMAELAEDENNEVEQKCHDVIKQMEKTLGEPLSKYF